MSDVISSAANPLVKRVRALASRKHRQRTGSFVVEGIQPVWQAVEAGAEIEVLLVAPDLLAASSAMRMVTAQEAAGVAVARLTDELFDRISGRRRSSGLAAIVRERPATLEELIVGADSLLVALHTLRNPGNLGTIVRTAVSAGAQAVVLLGDCADPYSPESVRASMGAIFAVPIVAIADANSFFDWTARHGIHIIGTSPTAPHSHWAVGYPLPSALLLGNEQRGLPPDVLARGDIRVRIPMVGTAESLNAAVAAAIMLYEMRRPTLARDPPTAG